MFQKFKNMRLQTTHIAILFGVLVIGLSNSALHPTSGNGGYTGAPGDASCGNCHTGNNTNLDGDITIDGLPATIETGETYTLTVTITNPNGNAVKAGFQMVALTGTNTNAGTMSNPSQNTQIRVAGGKNYFGHSPAQNFPGSNVLSFDVNWTAPASAGSVPLIKFYACTVIANGANGNQNDMVEFTNLQIPIQNAASPLSLDITSVEGVSCFGFANGSATANATGGSPPYSFSWNNGVNTQVNNFLPAGSATVTVTDQSGNSLSASTSIPTPPALTSTTTGSNICLNAENGTTSITANGGTGTKTYIWSNGMTGASITGLSSGIYTVTVEDANGCTSTNSAVVGVIPNPVFTGVVIPVNCHNTATGAVNITLQGSPAGVSYAWSNGATTAQISQLNAGNYQVTVTNAAGCFSTASYVVSQPSPLAGITGISQGISCFGGNTGILNVSSSGGSSPYLFVWSNGSSGSGLTHQVSQLTAGSYQVTITDQNGCSAVLAQNLGQPDLLTTQLTDADTIVCQGESSAYVSALAVGGTLPYQYSWSNGATTSSIEGLAAGNYTLTVLDANQCSRVSTVSITTSLLQIDSILVVQPTSDESTDGLLEAWFSGMPPVQFSWFKDGVFIDADSIIENAGIGTYQLSITDSSDCVIVSDSIVLSAPSAVQQYSQDEFGIFPVPATHTVWVKYPADFVIEGLDIFHLTGLKCTIQDYIQEKPGLLQISLNGFLPGSYVLKLAEKDGSSWSGRMSIVAE